MSKPTVVRYDKRGRFTYYLALSLQDAKRLYDIKPTQPLGLSDVLCHVIELGIVALEKRKERSGVQTRCAERRVDGG